MSGSISEIMLGDHAALFYRTKAEQLNIVIPFIAIGLERNERCLYIAEENTTFDICRKLEERGVDVMEAHKRGALSVVTKRETYLRHGAFQPDKMIVDLCDEAQKSLDLGFAGLRASGELSWALDLPSTSTQMVESHQDTLRKLRAGLSKFFNLTPPRQFEGVVAKLLNQLIFGGNHSFDLG